MRTEVWYPLGGFALLSFLALLIQGAVNIPLGKAAPWVGWFFGVCAWAFAATAGIYATRNTWIEDLLVFVVGLSPVILLLVALAFIAAVIYAALALVPDQFSSVALTTGLIAVAFFLPLMAKHAVPPGEVGDRAQSAVTSTTAQLAKVTDGWFVGGGAR